MESLIFPNSHNRSRSLLQLCAAIAATDFSARNKVKSILQISYEYLSAESIIAYSYNRLMEQLEIIAMPGVKQREFMRGPTDKLIFLWDPPPINGQSLGRWLETKDSYDAYLKELESNRRREFGASKPVPLQGSFRTREGSQAVAKICLWKGLSQTNDKVGQIFFNFTAIAFTDPLKQIICAVSTLVRELLIEELYHEDAAALRTKQAAPDRLLREVNRLFSTEPSADADTLPELESDMASYICDAARTVTENIGGYTDLAILDGHTFARIYGGHTQKGRPVLSIIERDSLTGKSIIERKYVVANDIPEKTSAALTDAFNKYDEFDPSTCKSLMLVPISHEGEVRAVVRLSNPRGGFFLDRHAKAMQELEVVSLECLLRLDERRQRSRMAAALEFYTASQSMPGREGFRPFLRLLLGPFGAEWGTYWPGLRIQDGRLQAIVGHRFTSDEVSSIDPSHAKYGLRLGRFVPGECGFSHLLYHLNQLATQNVFLSLHVLDSSSKPRFLLRLCCRQSFAHISGVPKQLVERQIRLSDGFYQTEFSAAERIGFLDAEIALNDNTHGEVHTRVSFVVREHSVIKGIVWLKFHGIHTVDWWERQYIEGLSGTIAGLEARYAFQLALRSFRHFLPGVCDLGLNKVTDLKAIQRLDARSTRAVLQCETAFYTLRLKADEIRVMLRALQYETQPESPVPRLPLSTVERSIEDFITYAIDIVSRGQRGHVYDVIYEAEATKNDTVGSIYYSVLLHLIDNAVSKGLSRLPEESLHKVVLYVKADDIEYTTTVADSGHELPEDPMHEVWQTKEDAEHGAGLVIIRLLLDAIGGSVRWLPKANYFQGDSRAPQVMRCCNTFFTFTLPRNH